MDCLVPFNPHHAKTILVFVFVFVEPKYCGITIYKVVLYKFKMAENIKSNKAWLVNLHIYLSNRLINSRKCNIRR